MSYRDLPPKQFVLGGWWRFSGATAVPLDSLEGGCEPGKGIHHKKEPLRRTSVRDMGTATPLTACFHPRGTASVH